MTYIVERGALRKRALQKKMLSHALESDDSKRTNVEIMTLRQYARELAYDKAWGMIKEANQLRPVATSLLATRFKYAQEHVDIEQDKIRVVVDAPIVNDDAIDKAIVLLTQVPEIKPGNKYVFGDKILVYDPEHSYG